MKFIAPVPGEAVVDQPKPDSAETRRLLQLGRDGDAGAFEELFRRHRAFVRQIIDSRLDDRLRARVDPSDIVSACDAAGIRGRFAPLAGAPARHHGPGGGRRLERGRSLVEAEAMGQGAAGA